MNHAPLHYQRMVCFKLNFTKLYYFDYFDVIQSQTGKVYAWGMGSNNQLGNGSDEDLLEPTLLTGQQVKDKNVINVSSGGQHTLFIVEDTNQPEKLTKGTNNKKR